MLVIAGGMSFLITIYKVEMKYESNQEATIPILSVDFFLFKLKSLINENEVKTYILTIQDSKNTDSK